MRPLEVPPPVSRRTFIAVTGLAAAGALAACTREPPAPRPTPTWTPPPTPTPRAGWQSRLVQLGDRGLTYREQDGLRLPDFGGVGYRGGRRPPDARVARTIGPVDGDCTAHLQRALDEVGALLRGDDGLRGTLVLSPGTYEIAGTIRLRRSGVVLRGSGDGTDPATATILRAVGDDPPGRDVVVVGGAEADSFAEVPGTSTDITSEVVAVASASFTVADPRRLRPGDPVVVTHPCTREWLDAVDHGGTGREERWEVGSLPIVHYRRVTDVAGSRVTLDEPVFTTLDRRLSQCRLAGWDRAGIVTDVGVENLRVDIVAAGRTDERHARNGIVIRSVEDGWVRRCTVAHFTQAGFVTTGAYRVTIEDCRAVDPAARVTGGRRYNFTAGPRSQLVLFTRCRAEGGRHAYVSNGTSSVSGVVFHRTTAVGSLASSEGHRRWSQGLLFDNHREVAPDTDLTLALYNRGDYGTGHGWSAAHSVAWACDVGRTALVVQRPPTAQNYAVGCTGEVSGDGPFEGPEGHIEGDRRPGLVPESLHDAQVADRAS